METRPPKIESDVAELRTEMKAANDALALIKNTVTAVDGRVTALEAKVDGNFTALRAEIHASSSALAT